MSTKTKVGLANARADMARELEKLDQRLIETAVKTQEPTHAEQVAEWRARLHATSVRMTQQVSAIRRRAERAKRTSGMTDIVEAIIEDQNNSK